MRLFQHFATLFSACVHLSLERLIPEMHYMHLLVLLIDSPFSMIPSKVHTGPSELYGALLVGARTAQRRIALSTLYVGTGHLETALVSLYPNNA